MLGAVGMCLGVAACATIPQPIEADAVRGGARWPGTTVATLAAGRARYVTKCSGCHALKSPARYPEERWVSLMDKMGDRAKLTADAREEILRYLIVMRERTATPPPP